MQTNTALAVPRSAKILAVFMALAVAIAFVPSLAYATSSKTVGKTGFTTTVKTIEKKAKTVKKGTTKLTYSKGQGYIQFKAPKTATYSFTFSKVKATKKTANNAFVEFQKKDSSSPKYAFLTDVKTKGGKTDTLWLSVNGAKFSGGYYTALDKPIASRTGKIKLKKGEKLYLYFYNSTGKTTTTLKIK